MDGPDCGQTFESLAPFKFRCGMTDASATRSPAHARHLGVDDDTILGRLIGELIPNLELKCESRVLSGLEEAGLPTMMN